jgi:hypothetical protein
MARQENEDKKLLIIRTRMERTTKPIDSPSLKILLIKRYPISEKDWSKEKSKSQSLQTIFSLLYLAYIILSNFILHNQEYILLILATIYLLTAYIGIIFGRFSYKNRLESADQARYFLFKDIDIVIEANYHYVFNKCHETLKSLRFQIVEVDESVGCLEAYSIPFLGYARQIRVKIEKVINSESAYMLKMSIVRLVNQRVDLAVSSKFANRFINKLINKDKNADGKTASKVNVPTDVEN